MRWIGGAALLLGLVTFAGLCCIPCLLGVFWLKGKLCRMDGARWEQYLDDIGGRGFLARILAVYLLTLLFTTAMGYGLFALFGFPAPWALALLTFLAGAARTGVRLVRRRQELSEKLRRLHERQPDGQAPER